MFWYMVHMYGGFVKVPVPLWDWLGYSGESRLRTEDTKKLRQFSRSSHQWEWEEEPDTNHHTSI